MLWNAHDRNDKKYCFWTWCSAYESHITKPCTGQINSTPYGDGGPCTLPRTTGIKVGWVRLCKQQNIHWRIHRRRKLSVRLDQRKDFYKLRTSQALNILSGLLKPAPFCDLNYEYEYNYRKTIVVCMNQSIGGRISTGLQSGKLFSYSILFRVHQADTQLVDGECMGSRVFKIFLPCSSFHCGTGGELTFNLWLIAGRSWDEKSLHLCGES